MKPSEPFFWIVILVFSGLLGFSYSTYQHLELELESLQKRITSLELKSTRQNRMSIVTVAPKPISTFRDQVYKSLQTLNGVQSPSDTQKEKRVLLVQNNLKVIDWSAATEDAFYDLLGTLMDEDLVEQIQLPDPARTDKAQRTLLRNIRQELLRFGVPAETVITSPENQFNIILKKSV